MKIKILNVQVTRGYFHAERLHGSVVLTVNVSTLFTLIRLGLHSAVGNFANAKKTAGANIQVTGNGTEWHCGEIRLEGDFHRAVSTAWREYARQRSADLI